MFGTAKGGLFIEVVIFKASCFEGEQQGERMHTYATVRSTY